MKKLISVLISSFMITFFCANVYAMGSKPGLPEKPYCQTKYPVILVPGVIGFDKLLGFIDYWYGIPDALENDGAIVFPVALSGWQSTEERGDQLVAFILRIKELYPQYTKFNFIAHSHGATTARYAMYQMPEVFASLTTIAGPHQGTPVADYLKEDLPDMARPMVYGGIEIFTGDLVALLSGHDELFGTQSAESCIEHFSIDGIEKFNNEYPCSGVPSGCPAGSYGDGENSANGSWYGDGLGNAVDRDSSGAIRFFSWMGNIGKGGTTSLDILDPLMEGINAMMRLYEYKGDADGFVPVSSAHFGQVISDSYYWNHFDEINQSFGIVSPFAANPIAVFRQHMNRLQSEGY